jgi:quinoprotein glucose dehydrogenase
MSDALDPDPRPHRVWPWILLAAVVMAVALAAVWVRAEVQRVRRYRGFDTAPSSRQVNDALAGFRGALAGGDAAAGRKIFFEKPEASCGRCHRVGGQGGDNGPALDGLSSRQTPEFILESLVDPNAKVSEGYSSVVVVLKSGSGVSGVLRSETESNLVIHTPDDGPVTVSKADIVRRVPGASPMPADFAQLISPSDLRDLMAFLQSLTTNAIPSR